MCGIPDVLHVDHGSDFTSHHLEYTATALKIRIIYSTIAALSVSLRLVTYCSFWSTFKNEYYHRHAFATIDAARRGAYLWIDGSYNARRRHSAIGYLSPLEYERRQLALAA